MRIGRFAASLLLLFGPPVLHAQATRDSVRLVVTVYDSLHNRALQGALVSVMQGARIAAEGSTNERGQAVFSALSPGDYSVTAFHSVLEPLDLGLRDDSVTIVENETTRTTLAVPGVSSFRKKICGSAGGGAAVIGTVNFGGAGLEDAGITVEWLSTLAPDDTSPRTPVSLKTQSSLDGRFRVCGIPAGVTAMLTITHGENVRTGGFVVDVAEPIISLTLQLSKASSSRFFTSLSLDGDSTASGASTDRTTLQGYVFSTDGLPLPNASVQTLQGSGTAVTGAKGEFSLAGVPRGAPVIVVRRAGFEAAEVHLGAALGSEKEGGSVTVLLRDNTAKLGAVTIAATPRVETAVDTAMRNIGFTTRQKHNVGEFITSEKIEAMRPIQFADLFQSSGVVVRNGSSLLSVRRDNYGNPLCIVYYLDDLVTELTRLNGLVREIGLIEAYEGNNAPAHYARQDGLYRCTIVMAWTKTRLGIR
jgi:hypothetical protein